MKAIISLFCVLFLATTVFTVELRTPEQWGDVDCDVDPPTPGDVVLLPDPQSCEHFYMCDGLMPVRKECPEGLHFNQEKRVCDWPRSAGCDWSYTPNPN